ncbi:hypothetical protein ACUR5C_07930 [Aliikangiella sp. IMCC44653]
MNKLLVTLMLLFIPLASTAEDVARKWNQLLSECESALVDGELKKARKLALELNAMDPSDTHVMYYIVLTSVELKIPVPAWLLEQPWPDATEVDKENYKRAMAVVNGT